MVLRPMPRRCAASIRRPRVTSSAASIIRASNSATRAKSGVLSQDGYHSVDPGKLTAAPMFALEVAERVDRGLDGGGA